MITLIATEESRQDIEELAAFFEGLNSPTISMRQEVGDVVRRLFGEHFDSEGSPVSGPWADLQKSTQIERLFQGYGGAHPILERDGNYRRSFTDFLSSDNIDTLITRPTGWTLELGSGDWRVAELEGGRDDMMARPVTMLSSGEANEIGDVLDRLFQQAADDMGMMRGA